MDEAELEAAPVVGDPAELPGTGAASAVLVEVPAARRDFRFLWGGQSLSLVGDQFMLVALPLLAVTTLGASVAQTAERRQRGQGAQLVGSRAHHGVHLGLGRAVRRCCSAAHPGAGCRRPVASLALGGRLAIGEMLLVGLVRACVASPVVGIMFGFRAGSRFWVTFP